MKNDESRSEERLRRHHPPQTVAPALTGIHPSKIALALAAQPGTPLQRRLGDLRRVIFGARRELDAREGEAFAAIGTQTFHRAFAPELLIAEAQRALEEAA